MAKTLKEDKVFATVLSDGAIHIEVPEGTLGSKTRTYETSDGKTGTKTEMVYKDISGIISKIDIRVGDYGSQLQITIDEEEEEKPTTLSLSTSSNFGEDFMKKLPNIDLSLPVIIAPYSFIDEKGKNKKGVTITQNGKKIQNYFYDFHTKENLYGYPTPKQNKNGKPLSSDQWKAYFLDARLFLIDFIKEKYNLESIKEMTTDEMEKSLNDFSNTDQEEAENF